MRKRRYGKSEDNPSLPEVTVGVDDPHSKALNPLLLSSNTLVTSKHAKGELVDPGLQHGPKLFLEVGGLILFIFFFTSFALCVGVQQTIRICCVVIVVSLDQGEERLGHIRLLICFRGWGTRGACPLRTTSPPGETEAAPAAIPRCLRFVSWAFMDTFLVVCTPLDILAGHFYTLHLKLSRGGLIM